MARYVFSAWKQGEADEIKVATEGWNAYRKKVKPNKQQYELVYWTGDRGADRIVLSGTDQVYIKGHGKPGYGFITPTLKDWQGTQLAHDKVAERFLETFVSDGISFVGLIKFYICNSAVEEGTKIHFARQATTLMRGHFPFGLFIGYTEPVSKDHKVSFEDPENPLAFTQHKRGTKSNTRAKLLQVELEIL